MERIQEAIEKARRERQGNIGSAQEPATSDLLPESQPAEEVSQSVLPTASTDGQGISKGEVLANTNSKAR